MSKPGTSHRMICFRNHGSVSYYYGIFDSWLYIVLDMILVSSIQILLNCVLSRINTSQWFWYICYQGRLHSRGGSVHPFLLLESWCCRILISFTLFLYLPAPIFWHVNLYWDYVFYHVCNIILLLTWTEQGRMKQQFCKYWHEICVFFCLWCLPHFYISHIDNSFVVNDVRLIFRYQSYMSKCVCSLLSTFRLFYWIQYLLFNIHKHLYSICILRN